MSATLIRGLLIFLFLSGEIVAQDIYDLARSGTALQMEKYLKKHPTELNLISAQGASPFLLAAYHGNNDVANLLIEKGADLTTCFPQGSVIYAVIYKNNLALLEALLKNGVNPNEACQFEQMGFPLHFAMTLQRYEAIEILMKYQLNLNIKDQQGRTLDQLLIIYADPHLNEILSYEE